MSRRQLLKGAVASGSTSLVSWFASGVARGEDSLLPPALRQGQFSYFTPEEIAFLDAAVARLIPTDELGPGAKEAGVTFFIDQQMAGSFGRGERWYMQGPWKDGTDEQGYQLKLTPAQLYRAAIAGTDDECRRTRRDQTFAELVPAEQDAVLHGLENGEISITGAPAKEFFKMLWQNTCEGYFADPLYGGNRDFAGWKLVGFPGPRYNYVKEIVQYGKPYARPTVGLLGRKAP